MARVNQYYVRGFKNVEYTKRSNGEKVTGVEVYLQAIEPDEGVFGDQLEAIYISSKYSTVAPEIGMCVRKVFNQWGKVEDLIEI